MKQQSNMLYFYTTKPLTQTANIWVDVHTYVFQRMYNADINFLSPFHLQSHSTLAYLRMVKTDTFLLLFHHQLGWFFSFTSPLSPDSIFFFLFTLRQYRLRTAQHPMLRFRLDYIETLQNLISQQAGKQAAWFFVKEKTFSVSF